MAPSFKRNRHSEEAFLLANFSEFVKCWSSGKKSRLVIESVNGHAIVNFTAFLGHPSADHFHFNSKPKNRQPKPRQKSERKIQRDNARAASFQERKRKEKALNPSPSTEEGKSIVQKRHHLRQFRLHQNSSSSQIRSKNASVVHLIYQSNPTSSSQN